MMAFFKKKITKDQCRDTGMAMVLLLLLLSISPKRQHGYLIAAIAVHVVNMILPQIFRPVAVVWLGFSNLLGEIVPKILLSIVFFLVVTPIGLLRRLIGKDALKLRVFKGSQDSVMLERNHTFVGRDLEKPY
jgi:saxitoxin biosynthesis operon SxtJ-like protein